MYELVAPAADAIPSASLRHVPESHIVDYLRHAPFSLAIRELDRMLTVERLRRCFPPPQAILDVGCGDGFWWKFQHRNCPVYGIDIIEPEVRLARTRIQATVCDIARERPFPEKQFGEIIGNCSLEHVRDIRSALDNIRACAAPGAQLFLIVPTPSWAYQGLTQGWLLKHAPRVAMMLAGAMNGFFQHWHLYDVSVWRELLHASGWKVRAYYGIGNERSEFIFRLFMPLGLISFLVKQLTGRYPNRLLRWVPNILLQPFVSLMQWALVPPQTEGDNPKAYEYVMVAELE